MNHASEAEIIKHARRMANALCRRCDLYKYPNGSAELFIEGDPAPRDGYTSKRSFHPDFLGIFR